ncbi:aminotransferase class III-fold pyridoxal phosphate-dependent enzyme [Bradyrhizobium sp. 145]|nr:aminotransferase class III-fold pyridoxal phosphate-dependent enzyme [Bradyrhizobium sp. 145]
MTKRGRADGAYLHTANGCRFIDAISSKWIVTHGHCHPNIVRAIKNTQARGMARFLRTTNRFCMQCKVREEKNAESTTKRGSGRYHTPPRGLQGVRSPSTYLVWSHDVWV